MTPNLILCRMIVNEWYLPAFVGLAISGATDWVSVCSLLMLLGLFLPQVFISNLWHFDMGINTLFWVKIVNFFHKNATHVRNEYLSPNNIGSIQYYHIV